MVIFERKSIYKNNYKIRVVKIDNLYDKPIYSSQIVENNNILFERLYKNKNYAISKAKQFDADLSWYKDIELLNNIRR